MVAVSPVVGNIIVAIALFLLREFLLGWVGLGLGLGVGLGLGLEYL